MSYDTRRRVIFLVAALIVVALVLASTGCSTSTQSGGSGDTAETGDEIGGAVYATEMSAICEATDERLAALPTPPEEISQSDWAAEVSRALRDEAASFELIRVGSLRRDDHASFVENTLQQAESWSDVSDALTTSPDGSAEIVDQVTEIAELTLGRNDLASEMTIAGCQERDLG